jgi:acyl carrier protein
MKDTILEYIIKEFGSSEPKERRTHHYSYCSFPEEECVCKDLNEITYDTPLISGGYIDSFSMVSVLIFLEKTFDVKIPDKDAIPVNFNTVNDMVSLVNKCKNNGTGKDRS